MMSRTFRENTTICGVHLRQLAVCSGGWEAKNEKQLKIAANRMTRVPDYSSKRSG